MPRNLLVVAVLATSFHVSVGVSVAVSVVPWCNHSIRVRMNPGNTTGAPGAFCVTWSKAALHDDEHVLA